MKKIAAGATATVFAVAGLSALTVAPAAAAPYENCTAAYQDGVANIPEGSPNYGEHLDRDRDGVGCEDPDYPPVTDPNPVPPVAPQPPVVEPEVGYVPDEDAWAYNNCTEARAAGAVNIPAGTPGYGPHLDRDLDGIGCEAGVDDDAADDVVMGDPGSTGDEVAWDGTQVEQMPAGGADTGVPVEGSAVTPGLVGLSALALAAFAGSGLLLRRAARG